SNSQGHLVVTATASGMDASIFGKHGRNAERVPDTVSIPGTFADANRKWGWNGGEGRDPPQFSVVLCDEGVAFAQTREPCMDGVCAAAKGFRHLRECRASALRDDIAVDEEAELGVGGLGIGGHRILNATRFPNVYPDKHSTRRTRREHKGYRRRRGRRCLHRD